MKTVGPDPGEIQAGARVRVPEHVLFQAIEGQSALLHLGTETYYGLDEVGTRVWRALTTSETLGAALTELEQIYDVDRNTLERDVLVFVEELRVAGLVELE